MKSHIQNPHTRSPQVFLHLTVEETQQLESALVLIDRHASAGFPTALELMDRNQRDALQQLRMRLEEVLGTDPPRGIRGALP